MKHLIALATAVLLVLMAGCATQSKSIPLVDDFVRRTLGPEFSHFQYCVATQKETPDGRTPTQGPFWWSCLDDLGSAKIEGVAYCEKNAGVKCMPTWYFRRGDYVQTYENENVARKEQEAAQTQREKLASICDGYGFRRNTTDHAYCVMQQVQSEKNNKLQQEMADQQRAIANQLDQQRRMNLFKSAAEQLRSNGQKICTTQPNGTIICQ